jgi:two-component system, NarL family, response regulator DesR
MSAALTAQSDVALLGIEMPGGDGPSAAKALHDALPGRQVILLTTCGLKGYL